jgi:signal transduction histidine kinase
MSRPLIFGCIWVIAAALVAMMPMRLQYRLGFVLLLAAPVLIVWIGAVHGWPWAILGLLAFGSMFRKPLFHLARYLTGRVGR